MSVKAKVRLNEIAGMNRSSERGRTRGLTLQTLAAAVVSDEIGSEPPKILTAYPKRRVLNENIPDNKIGTKERMLKILCVIIYLMALSGTGFTLSFYYLFFWDSTMPPVYKPPKKFI